MKNARVKYLKEPSAQIQKWVVKLKRPGGEGYRYFATKKQAKVWIQDCISKGKVAELYKISTNFIEAWTKK